MKIELPIQAKDYDLNDREKIFCFLMVQISKGMKSSEWKNTEFQFYTPDINTILDVPLKYRKRVLNIFTIGRFNEHTCRVRRINPKPVHTAGAQSWYPKTYTDELTEGNHIELYMYMLGRLYDPTSLFSENQKPGLYKNQGKQNTNISEIFRSSPASTRNSQS
jgi:hypothetical protein